MLFLSLTADSFSKLTFSENSFRNTIRMSNCFQRISGGDISVVAKFFVGWLWGNFTALSTRLGSLC